MVWSIRFLPAGRSNRRARSGKRVVFEFKQDAGDSSVEAHRNTIRAPKLERLLGLRVITRTPDARATPLVVDNAVHDPVGPASVRRPVARAAGSVTPTLLKYECVCSHARRARSNARARPRCGAVRIAARRS